MKTTIGQVITYIDVQGNKRKVKCIERPDYYVDWKKQDLPSLVGRYMDENGSIIQIPDNAWDLVKVVSKDG